MSEEHSVSDGNGRSAGDEIGQGRVVRVAPLVGLAARTVAEALLAAARNKLAGAGDPEFHARAAESYAEHLGRSKGLLMKVGQLLAIASLHSLMPPEVSSVYQRALRRLEADAPPMHPDLARSVLERELERPVEEAFAEFDWRPLAAASIGQVHSARLHDGRRAAVKIQYPGVAGAIRADLDNTQLVTAFLEVLRAVFPGGVRTDLRGAAAEIEARIAEELDYRLEAVNQAKFASVYSGHPFIHVPQVIDELSTARVLTQELVEGRSFSEALTAPQEVRDRWGEAIFRFWYGSLQRLRVFNGDPHPGNYLFHDDGSVSFLDFGCVKRFGEEQLATLNALMSAAIAGDALGTWRVCIEAGWLRSSDGLTPEEVLEYWHEPFRMFWGEQPFTMTPEFVASFNERLYSPRGPSGRVARYNAAPGDQLLIVRIDLGLWPVLGELRATTDWGSIEAELREDRPPSTAMGRLEQERFDWPAAMELPRA